MLRGAHGSSGLWVISLDLLTVQPTSITCKGRDHRCLLLPALLMKLEFDYFAGSSFGPCPSIWLLPFVCLEFWGHEFCPVLPCVCKPELDRSSLAQHPPHPHLRNIFKVIVMTCRPRSSLPPATSTPPTSPCAASAGQAWAPSLARVRVEPQTRCQRSDFF